MTGQQIYEAASAFLYERDMEDLDSKHFSIPFLNLLLQECLEVENSIRKFNEEPELDRAQELLELDETIVYDDTITRGALPYGLASFFFQEATDNFQAENYRARYLAALQSAIRYNTSTIVNMYD